MRISSQGAETVNRSILPAESTSKNTAPEKKIDDVKAVDTVNVKGQQLVREEGKEASTKEQLQNAVSMMNELLESTQKSSKFVYHEGLDKYYVKLVDSKTEEVIKEIPPERLLDAFYQMQKLAGVIVDEKI